MHRGDDGKVTSPATMWCEALELAVQRLADLTDLSDIVAVSGSGQQHATVYLSEKGVTALEALDPAWPLVRQFDGCFARASPAWLDTSTGQECAELEEAAGRSGRFFPPNVMPSFFPFLTCTRNGSPRRRR